MFPNFSGWLYVKAALFALVTLDAVLMTSGAFSPAVLHYASVASLFLGAAGTIVTTLSGSTLATPAIVRLARRAASASAFCLVLAGALACQACSGAQQSQELTLGIDTTVCVLNHVTDAPAKIALECGVQDIMQVQKIINAHHAAMLREEAVDGGVRP